MKSIAANGKPFFGWIVVWSAFTIAIFGWGVGFYGPPIYLKAVQDLRGWSLGLTSAAVTFHFLSGVLVVANLPTLHRRFGLPMVTLGGAVVLALGITGWAQAREPWQLFLAALLSGGGWVALGAAGINAMLAPWFAKRRPAALSTAYNGASVGGILFSPLWAGLIAAIGFAAAAMTVGVVMIAIVGLLAVLVLSRSPASLGQFPDGADGPPDSATSGDAIPLAPRLTGDAAFITLAAGMALGLFAQIGLIAHLFSILAPKLGDQGAGFAGALMTGAAIAGRTAFGWLAPVGVDRRRLAVTSYGIQMLGCALLIAADGFIPLTLVGVCLIGLGVGNATSIPPLIVQSEFSRAQGPRVVALITATAQATYAFAPALFGLLRADAGEAESVLFLAAAGVQLLAALCFLAGAKRWMRRDAKTAAPSVRHG